MGRNIRTIKEIRVYLAKELNDLYDEAEINSLANIIIRTTTGISKLHSLYMPEKVISEENVERILSICSELKRGRPIQYILGETVFYDLTLKLTEATLIPRPETEELVDIIVKEQVNFKGNIIDVGTGSGCIAIALAKNIPGSGVAGFDISEDAVKVAQGNARLNNVPVSFFRMDLFNINYDTIGKADIIVSNPPYVRESERLLMKSNVLDYEPHIALFVTDTDPLIYYRAVLDMGVNVLCQNGIVYFEINEAMGPQMKQLLTSYEYTEIQILNDINNKARFIKGIGNGRK